MRFDTALVVTKGACFMIVGVFSPWAAALAQWIGSGEWPPKIVWVAVILPASAIGGASSLLSFLSGSFTDYRRSRNLPEPQKPV